MGDHGVGGDNCMVPDRDSWHDHHHRTQPDIISDSNVIFEHRLNVGRHSQVESVTSRRSLCSRGR